MSGGSVELDFFGMEKENTSKTQFQKLLEQRRTVRGIQTAISKINPQVLKNVIGSGAAAASGDGNIKQELVFGPNGVLLTSENSFSVPSTPKVNQGFLSPLPVYNPILRAASDSPPGTPTAPLTIFYNGTVSVFDVPRDKAEIIMKLAEEGNSKPVESVDPKIAFTLPSSDQQKLLEKLNGDMPRKKSLQRFLEKRKERYLGPVRSRPNVHVAFAAPFELQNRPPRP